MYRIIRVLLLTVTFNQVQLFELSVIHVNDFHARFEETNEDGGQCQDRRCIGGFSRLYYEIMHVLQYQPHSLVLNGGDNFQGTLYYTLFKWNITQQFLNKIPFDAFVLGTHEFDDGIDGLVPFIQHLKAPVIVANIDDSEEPAIENLIKKSVVVNRDGRKIGIIGVLIKTANQFSNTGQLKFYDEAESVIAEAERLAAEEGVFTNIVLSHIGYELDKELAKKVTAKSKIGLIVGGYSHTLLDSSMFYNGPDEEQGPYPTVVNRTDGRKILIVQAYAYCRYLGNITVYYDNASGNVEGWSGRPIFLNDNPHTASAINDALAPWKKEIDAIGDKVLGSTLVGLDSSNCRIRECVLGNFVTDAMVYAYTSKSNANYWTYAALAVMHPSGLGKGIGIGNITYNDLFKAQPLGNTFDVGEIQGKYIKKMFEYSVGSSYYTTNLAILQVSGFKVVCDLTKPRDSRVVSIEVRCNECPTPIYEDLDEDKYYRLIVPSFLRNGGDDYTMISDNLKNVTIGRLDVDVISEYVAAKSPIFQEIEGRIRTDAQDSIETESETFN